MYTRTTIVIGGTPDQPAITRLPERLVGRRGTEFEWEIENASGRPQEIALAGFSDERGAKQSPLQKSDTERRTTPDKNGVIRDRVRDDAGPGVYKYEIWLNGGLAVDPEVEIKEEG